MVLRRKKHQLNTSKSKGKKRKKRKSKFKFIGLETDKASLVSLGVL